MNLKLADIPRVSIGAKPKLQVAELPEMEQERAMLGQRALDLLGYGTLISSIAGGSVTVADKIGPLGTALLQHKIEVLDVVSVVSYQQEEVRRRNQDFVEEMVREGRLSDYIRSYGWTPAKWDSTPISSYTHPIPEFVLSKAIQVKEAMPEVEIFIQHLNEPTADPFLIVKHNRELYFIEAWEEPRFEGRASR